MPLQQRFIQVQGPGPRQKIKTEATHPRRLGQKPDFRDLPSQAEKKKKTCELFLCGESLGSPQYPASFREPLSSLPLVDVAQL